MDIDNKKLELTQYKQKPNPTNNGQRKKLLIFYEKL